MNSVMNSQKLTDIQPSNPHVVLAAWSPLPYQFCTSFEFASKCKKCQEPLWLPEQPPFKKESAKKFPKFPKLFARFTKLWLFVFVQTSPRHLGAHLPPHWFFRCISGRKGSHIGSAPHRMGAMRLKYRHLSRCRIARTCVPCFHPLLSDNNE